jgi:hypothetical protein
VLFLSDRGDQRVANRYRDTIPRDKPFAWDAARGQLQLFVDLGVRAGRGEKIIEEVDRKLAEAAGTGGTATPAPKPLHVVLFAGHRIDAPGRLRPRFPSGRADLAKTLIARALTSVASADRELVGFASAAPGGDLLFHEACADLGVRSLPCLPMPAEKYSGHTFRELDDWRSRFLTLLERNRQRGWDVLELSDQEGLPRWLAGSAVNPWERGNQWVLQMALASDAERITLLALWDGEQAGDDLGGTAQMVRLARAAGRIDVKVIDTRELL